MSVDGKMCRICLLKQTTSKFNLVFGNNGKIAKQIFDVTGLKVLEFRKCPALVCPKCTGALQKAYELQQEILESNRHFNEIYKLCRFEYDVDFGTDDEEDEWEIEKKCEIVPEIEQQSTSEMAVFETSTDVFVITHDIKEEPEEIHEDKQPPETIQESSEIYTYLDPQTGFVIKTEIKEEAPVEFQYVDDEFHFDDLPDEVLAVLDDEHIEYPEDHNEAESDKPISKYLASRKRGRKENSLALLCPLCGYKACSDLDSQEHLATEHNAKKRKMIIEPEVVEKNWMCCYCGENFNKKINCIKHRNNEHKADEESLKCLYCYKEFTQAIHLRIHTKYTHLQKSFTCPKCEIQFTNPDEFKDHMRLENSQREFICEICTSSFMLSHLLTNHMKTHKNDQIFFCEQCGVKFSTQSLLKKHNKAVHLKIMSFKCGACQKGFTLKHLLKEHLNRGHCGVEKS